MVDGSGSTRLVVVSNRLPVALKQVDGEWRLTPGSGGLVSAMAPVLRNRGGTWIGWNGAADGDDTREVLAAFSRNAGYDLRAVSLSLEEIDGYYHGFSNETVWPLFHDMLGLASYAPENWRTYLEVNHKFALEVAQAGGESDYIWVHDYHLMHVAWVLRQMGIKRKTGFFLHIPFPSPDILLKLPWRTKVIQALLAYDLVGFQTTRDRRNFTKCVQLFHPQAKARGRGAVVSLTVGDRSLRAGSFPIGIDYTAYAGTAAQPGVVARAAELRRTLDDRIIFLGVDRLDYTKGIPQRFEALRTALTTYPELLGAVSLIQVAVPSREEVGAYKALKEEIERLVGDINGRFSRPGYIPIHYMYRSLGKEELCAYYRAADVALVTPLRDGMNLVAKEYVACNHSRTGVLLLSEFAGAAAQLQNGAILVNPHDVEGVAKSIRRACRLPEDARRMYMRKMQDTVRRTDIFGWVDSFLHAAFSRSLDDFPALASEGVDYSLYGVSPGV
ncbi:MAG: trehalose-6-phosphate synthase [Desulfovibrionaceae bacterium]